MAKVARIAKYGRGGSRPGERRGGRQKGTPNKVTVSVKQAVLDTFTSLGGVEHMTAWAREHPTEFYRIAARLIPYEAVGDDSAPIRIVPRIVLVDPKGNEREINTEVSEK